MCDSDDDEFVSASEGEYEDEEKPLTKKQSEPTPAAKEVQRQESEESDSNHSSLSVSRSTASEKSSSQSLPTDKKELLAQVVKETEALDIEPPQLEEAATPEQSSENIPNVQKEPLESGASSSSYAEGTASTAEQPSKPLKEQVTTPKVETVGGPSESKCGAPVCKAEEKPHIPTTLPQKDKEKVKEKKETKTVAEDPIDDSSGWDDWGDEDVPTDSNGEASTEGNDGWDDWSLVEDQKPKRVENKPKAAPNQSKKPTFRDTVVPRQLVEDDNESAGWGWGGIVSAVGETFSSTIESSLGLPSAEMVAQRKLKEQKERASKEKEKNEMVPPSFVEEKPHASNVASSGMGLFSGLVTGGIDVLESIGKKTFEAITVTDPKGTGRRRLMFSDTGDQNLSDVLKELRQREEQEKERGIDRQDRTEPQLPCLASLFERSEGMAHLEALEMLSSSMPKPAPKIERELLSALSSANTDETSQLSSFQASLRKAVKSIGLPFEPKTVISADLEIASRLSCSQQEGKSPEEVFEEAVQSLVQFTVASVQVVSKLANLLIVAQHNSNWSDFVELFSLLGLRLNQIAEGYTEVLSTGDDPIKGDELSTQLLVEASTGLDFLKQAHKLVIPIFSSN